MPKGSFVIILPLDKDYKVLGYYFKDGHSIFEVTTFFIFTCFKR